MAPEALRITQRKRLALANCNGLLDRACDELEAMMGKGASDGLCVEEVEDLAPLTMRVFQLRERRRRLEDELQAISAEWAE